MKKKIAFLAVYAMLFALRVSAEAQQVPKMPRIGFLSAFSRSSDRERVEAFREELRELGYVEGQNVVIEYRYGEGNRDWVRELAAELVRLKADLIVAAGGSGLARVAKETTKTIPIVLTGGSDPVGAGLVASLARPGGNITGLTAITAELAGERLELLKETLPRLTRVGVLWNPTDQGSAQGLKEMEIAASDIALGDSIASGAEPQQF
jgi:putative tryptophan/tyrosine transport system substrate-binding protein